jgi:predicted DNA-binding transcriptional regulator YafY
MVPTVPKLQRWTDLLAALLRRHYPVTFEALRRDVPAYDAHKGALTSLMRKFERDKDELRAFGVPIETITGLDGNHSEYRLASKAFYLPYLQLATDRQAPKRPRGMGYQGLPILAFEPDELAAVVRAGRRVQALGDSALAREAGTALRKLAHDLPMDGADSTRELIVQERALDGELFDHLADAVRSHKTVTFTYHSMHRGERATRRVDPYGIAYVNGNWYLVGFDHDADGIRHFRATRITKLDVHAKAPQTADFDVPDSFDLWEHTKSRQAWELGDAEARTVIVRFHESRGSVAAAMRLGSPVAGDPTVRGFRVRRVDSFLRWILGFAGAARPVDPPEMVREFGVLLRTTLANYSTASREP